MDQGNFSVVTIADDGSEKRIARLTRKGARTLAAAHRSAGRRCAIRYTLADGKDVTVIDFDEPLDRMTP